MASKEENFRKSYIQSSQKSLVFTNAQPEKNVEGTNCKDPE